MNQELCAVKQATDYPFQPFGSDGPLKCVRSNLLVWKGRTATQNVWKVYKVKGHCVPWGFSHIQQGTHVHTHTQGDCRFKLSADSVEDVSWPFATNPNRTRSISNGQVELDATSLVRHAFTATDNLFGICLASTVLALRSRRLVCCLLGGEKWYPLSWIVNVSVWSVYFWCLK